MFLSERDCDVLFHRKYVLEKFHSDMNDNVVGHEFNVDKSTIYIK